MRPLGFISSFFGALLLRFTRPFISVHVLSIFELTFKWRTPKVNSHTGRKINSHLIKHSNLKVLPETVLAIVKEGISLPKFLFGEKKKRKTTKFYDF